MRENELRIGGFVGLQAETGYPKEMVGLGSLCVDRSPRMTVRNLVCSPSISTCKNPHRFGRCW